MSIRFDIKTLMIVILLSLIGVFLFMGSGSKAKYQFDLAKEVYEIKIHEIEERNKSLIDSISFYEAEIKLYADKIKDRDIIIQELKEEKIKNRTEIERLKRERRNLQRRISSMSDKERLEFWRNFFDRKGIK